MQKLISKMLISALFSDEIEKMQCSDRSQQMTNGFWCNLAVVHFQMTFKHCQTLRPNVCPTDESQLGLCIKALQTGDSRIIHLPATLWTIEDKMISVRTVPDVFGRDIHSPTPASSQTTGY